MSNASLAAEKESLRRVRDALDHVRIGLTPFVEARMKKARGLDWLRYASRASGGTSDALDAYGLLKTMLDNWRDVFAEAFRPQEKYKARTFASLALEARNAIAHLTLPLADDEALRYLDATHHLLRLAKASDAEVSAVRALYDEQRRGGPAATPQQPSAPPPSTLNLEKPEPQGKALRPWREIALPRADVTANRFREAEFAADLAAVDQGVAAGESYAMPAEFFGMTFLTEGLKRVLASTLQRLGGTGGDPVIGLQTAFGGGKTHTLLAVYHLAKHLKDGADPARLKDLGPLVAATGVKSWPKPAIAVFVGSAKGPDVSLTRHGQPPVRTVWGYIAWRLARDRGLKLLAEAEAAGTNPGSELLAELFRLSGPSVILLDELTTFARQLDEDRFEAFLSFLQSLTEAAKMVPKVLVVGSLPESQAEAGGARGQRALLRLEKIFGRLQSPWLPAAGDETYKIIRRRLFEPLDQEGERARDQVTKAFFDMYRKNPAEFPPETKDPRYLELLRLSYPIHPELFERLSKDWSGLEKFQRTRGVLRFLANVIATLWRAEAHDPLITPARVPLSDERVRAGALYALEPGFAAVLDKEVDGEGALSARMEMNPSRRISQAHAASRAARAVFLCSAPSVGQPNAGITGRGLRLACAEPGDQPAVFGDALRELTEQATYLYEQGGRYWFSTKPTLNHLAQQKARLFAPHEVDAAIARVLADDIGKKGGFHHVFPPSDDPTAIDEVDAISLVIVGPEFPHAGKSTVGSKAAEIVREVSTRCRTSQRCFRNTLLFVAPDEAGLTNAREVIRNALAWEAIVSDETLARQLDGGQLENAKKQAREHREGAVRAVRTAWCHIFYPIKSETPGEAFTLDHARIASRDPGPLPTTVYEKAKADKTVLEHLGPERLWLALGPIWPADRPHLPIVQVIGWFTEYAYLPKLRDKVVLQTAIRDAVAELEPRFGYAESYDETSGRYRGLVWARHPPDVLAPAALLVRASEARAQATAEAVTPPAGGREPTAGPSQPNGTQNGGTSSSPATPTHARPRRFYGSVEIDMARPVKAFDAILNAVVMELQRTTGAKVKLTLEIEGEAEAGFADEDVSVVRDNAKQLKFRTESTGFE